VAFLQQHEMVAAIAYPELDGHPDQELAARLLPLGCGAVFSFDLKGGRDAGIAFVDALNLFSHLANVGDAKSLVIHPASTTHHRMDRLALRAAGISSGTIRLSVGLEQVSDLIGDLKQGLRAAEKIAALESAQ
jgi:O-acetylhomoserine (thiol)-lyase